MRLRATRLLPLTAVFLVTLGLSASSGRREADRLDDTFAVLSALLDRPAPGQALLAEKGHASPYEGCGLFTLVSDGVWPRESDQDDLMECLHLPLETRRALQADMAAHRFHRLEIPSSRLSLTRPYGRMTVSESRQRNGNRPSLDRALVEVGYVYFNADRTIAAVRASLSCYSLGSEGGWQVFERSPNGPWTARPRIGGCTWVS